MSLMTGEYWAAVEGKADKWVPACGGTEVPMMCNGSMWLYVFNPFTQQHGWLNIHTDIVHNEHPNLSIEERKVLP